MKTITIRVTQAGTQLPEGNIGIADIYFKYIRSGVSSYHPYSVLCSASGGFNTEKIEEEVETNLVAHYALKAEIENNEILYASNENTISSNFSLFEPQGDSQEFMYVIPKPFSGIEARFMEVTNHNESLLNITISNEGGIHVSTVSNGQYTSSQSVDAHFDVNYQFGEHTYPITFNMHFGG